MTKKKNRKGRDKKEAQKKQEEDGHRPHHVVREIIVQNVQMQQWNMILEPLYEILTCLELKVEGPEGSKLLQKINLQDYDKKNKDTVEYYLDKVVSLEVSCEDHGLASGRFKV